MRKHKFHVPIIGVLILVSNMSLSLAAETKALPTTKCLVDHLPSWSKQEQSTWKAICAGNDIDFNKLEGYGGELDPASPDDWPSNRVLSAEFLKTILLDARYKKALSHLGVRIIGAWFKDEIDFSNALIDTDLWLEHCIFDAPVTLYHARLSQSLSFDYSNFAAPVTLATSTIAGALSLGGSWFNNTLDLTEIQVDSTVLIAEGARFLDKVSFTNAKFGSDLLVVNSHFTQPVNFISIQVNGDVIFEDNHFAKRIDLGLSVFSKHFYLMRSIFGDDLDLRSMRTKFNFYLNDIRAEKDLILSSSEIGGDLRLENSNVVRNLYLKGIALGGDLLLSTNEISGSVFSSNISVDKQIKAESNTFDNDVILQKAKTLDSVFFHNNIFNSRLYVNSADIGDQIEFIDNDIEGLLNLNSTQIKTHLLLRENRFNNEVSIGQAVLGGQLDIQSSQFINKVKAEGILLDNLYITSSAFLEEVHLLHAKLTGAISIDNTTFSKLVYLGNIETQKASAISQTTFLGPISMSSSVLNGRLTLVENIFHDEFLFTDATINNGLFIVASHFQNDVDFDRTKIMGTIAISDRSQFESRLDLEDVVIANSFFLDGNSILEKEINATGIKCHGNFELADSTFFGTVKLEFAEIGGSLVLGANSTFNEDVSLSHAKVQRQITMDKAIFKHTLNMEGVHAGAVFLGEGALFEGDVSLAIATIDTELSASQSTFKETVGLTGIKIGQNLVLGDKATFDKPITVNSGEIAGGVIIPASNLYFVDFSEASIGGLLNLGVNGDDDPRWHIDGGVDLGNARVGSIQVPVYWDKGINLDGLVYGHLGGDVLAETPMLSRDANWYITLLELQNNYSPQPYKFLAEKLKENGQIEKSAQILYAGRDRERANSGATRWIWLSIQKYVIGYGIGGHIFYVCYWIVLFISIGTIIIYKSEEGKKEGRGMAWAVFYSIDKLLPIIKLDKEHDDLMPGGPAKYYFYLHIFTGYVLALFLVAGITGLTNK